MIKTIIARDNKKLKVLNAISTKKGREKNNAYLVEGKRMVMEAVEYVRQEVKYVVAGESFYRDNRNLVQSIDLNQIPVYIISDKLFADISDTITPQGIAAAVTIPRISEFDYKKAGKVLILDGVSEPGNMGTIIRTSEAAGVDCILLMKGCADIYNPKVVRSTMGSIFRTRFIYADSYEEISLLKENGFNIAASYLGDSIDLYEYKKSVKSSVKTAIVIGSEAFGVSEEMLKLSDTRIHIPMHGKVESLNAAVAAGILLYLL